MRFGLFIAVLTSMILSGCAPTDPRPNVIVILADDLGIGDLGCYGQSYIKTPNINRLRDQGLLFTSFFAGGLTDAPARTSLLTGLHTGHTPIRGDTLPAVPLADTFPTLARILQSKGYATSAVGYWGIGDINGAYGAERFGFNEHHGVIHDPIRDTDIAQYAQDKALEFIRKNKRNAFFLYYATPLPGAAMPVSMRYAGMYRKQLPVLPIANYMGMVATLDQYIGQLLRELKELGIDDKTLVILTTDQGALNDAETQSRVTFFNSNHDRRGGKGEIYDGALRVPLLTYWKGKIAPGGTTNQVVAAWDLMPMILNAFDIAPPDNLDGTPLPILTMPDTKISHAPLYWEHNGNLQAIRVDDWKLIRFLRPKPKIELYNLFADPQEKESAEATYPVIVEKLLPLLDSFRICN